MATNIVTGYSYSQNPIKINGYYKVMQMYLEA